MRENKFTILVFIHFLVFAFNVFPQNHILLDNTKERLSQRGYIVDGNPFAHPLEEYLLYKEKYNGKKAEALLRCNRTIDGITYYFIFYSFTEPNCSVVVYILDDYGNILHNFYKVNTDNEPPNLWIDMDMNKDGIIEEGEGRYAWY